MFTVWVEVLFIVRTMWSATYSRYIPIMLIGIK